MTPPKPMLRINDFAANIIAGLKELAMSDPDIPTEWSFIGRYANQAARAVYAYLEELDQFDLRFRIYLHSIHGDSSDWISAVQEQMSIYRTISKPSSDGFYEISSLCTGLEERMMWPNAVGDRDLWIACATLFAEKYSAG